MRAIPIFVVLMCCLVFLPNNSHADDSKLFNAQTFTLDNGLRVVLVRNTRVPVVAHMVWYNAGSADENFGKTGLAHYMEHLMFKGSPNVAPGDFSKTVRALGGEDNAFTSYDYTAYFQTIASENLEKMMTMEADRMVAMNVPAEEAVSELKVVLEERRNRLENNPTAQFFKDIRHALYASHPYERPIIGYKSDIQNLNLNDAYDFHDKYYAPNNATLIVSGDIDLDDLKKLATKYYADIAKSDVVERSIQSSPDPLLSKKEIVMKSKRVRQPLYARGYRVPSWTQNREEVLVLTVLSEMLASGSDSPLYQEMVVDQKLATSISLSYNSQALGPGELSINATLAEGVHHKTLSAAITNFFKEYREKGFYQSDVNLAVTKIEDSTIFLRDSITGPAMIIGRALASGMTLEEIERYSSLLKTVTISQIEAVFDKYLHHDALFVEGTLQRDEGGQS